MLLAGYPGRRITWFLIGISIAASQCAASDRYGDRLSGLSAELLRPLAKRQQPDNKGAMGRNRQAYVHVRFQMGLHQLADYALMSQDLRALQAFFRAAEYAMHHQQADGDFLVRLPAEMNRGQAVGIADRTSGVAFFMYSLGSAAMALESNQWFAESAELAVQRAQLASLKSQLPDTLTFLLHNRVILQQADSLAPNRLLFNALAFYTLGHWLEDATALSVADAFIEQALAQVHDDGYFIEAGGYDSSYNGVATALCYRLLLLGHPHPALPDVCAGALSWQQTRLLPSGEINAAGNSRVKAGGQGESFMGRQKDVDVGHTIEALMLAALYQSNESLTQQASQVLDYYLKKR